MKRWPTEPVAPSTPTIRSADYNARAAASIPHFFLGNSGVFDVKCSASIFVVANVQFLSQLLISSFMTRVWGGKVMPITEVRRLLIHTHFPQRQC